jgi:hypothetical protein
MCSAGDALAFRTGQGLHKGSKFPSTLSIQNPLPSLALFRKSAPGKKGNKYNRGG